MHNKKINDMHDMQMNNTNLNITLKNDDSNEDAIHISFSTLFNCMKRFFLAWITLAVLAVLFVSAGTATFSHQLSSAPVSLIGFDYPNAEKGLTPNGDKLDVNTIKNPVVIEAALTKLDYPLTEVDSIRNAISIDGVIPADAANEISVYKQALEKNGNLQVAQSMLDVDYFPTKYKITFDFTKTNFGDEEAAQVINTVLECYRDYFFEQYGYNESIGNSLLAIDYSDYDYLVAVDTYTETLIDLQEKVNSLRDKDFRSTQTGYSFEDLNNSISTAKAYDADALTAYILSNSVITNKGNMISFYEYRIDELERQKKSAEENLKTIENSIANYEKDSIVVHGSISEYDSNQYTTISQKYDELFEQKQDAQKVVSSYSVKISECKTRLDSVKKLTENNANEKDIEYVENRITLLDKTVRQLVDDVNTTIMEYHESVTFANAYSVLVPANVLSTSYISMLLSNIIKPLLLVEVLVFVIYISVSVVCGLRIENRIRKNDDLSEEITEENEISAE